MQRNHVKECSGDDIKEQNSDKMLLMSISKCTDVDASPESSSLCLFHTMRYILYSRHTDFLKQAHAWRWWRHHTTGNISC